MNENKLVGNITTKIDISLRPQNSIGRSESTIILNGSPLEQATSHDLWNGHVRLMIPLMKYLAELQKR